MEQQVFLIIFLRGYVQELIPELFLGISLEVLLDNSQAIILKVPPEDHEGVLYKFVENLFKSFFRICLEKCSGDPKKLS